MEILRSGSWGGSGSAGRNSAGGDSRPSGTRLSPRFGEAGAPSQGATHYLNPVVTRRLREKAGKGLTLPDWVEKMTLTAVIGRHHFYK